MWKARALRSRNSVERFQKQHERYSLETYVIFASKTATGSENQGPSKLLSRLTWPETFHCRSAPPYLLGLKVRLNVQCQKYLQIKILQQG